MRRSCAKGSPPRVRGKVFFGENCRIVHGITPAYAGKRRAGTGQWACRRDHPRVCGEKLRTSSRLSTSWDHPRVCGEKALSTFSSRKNSGSPPRVRGKGQIAPLGAVPVGITPACAGKRCVYSAQNQSLRDHPRVCGEKRRVRSWRALLLGSPPRMRGKDGVSGACHSPPGITPACAGKSLRPDNNPSTSWDHPRVCGEKTKKIP